MKRFIISFLKAEFFCDPIDLFAEEKNAHYTRLFLANTWQYSAVESIYPPINTELIEDEIPILVGIVRYLFR